MDIGSWSEYAVCPEDHLALKPASLSFGDAASLPLAAMTALQAFRKYEGSLEGKTVFVPAGCKSRSKTNETKDFTDWFSLPSERHRCLRLPAREERLQSGQSHHHGVNGKGTESSGVARRRGCGSRSVFNPPRLRKRRLIV